MKKYRSHEVVDAEKIRSMSEEVKTVGPSGSYTIHLEDGSSRAVSGFLFGSRVGPENIHDHYFVRFQDGYEILVPAEQFESRHDLVEESTSV